MANVLNTLYPPTISTFLPAFVNTTEVFIYFSLSPYNSSSEIKRVHVSLTNQLNNENAFNNLSGIVFKDLKHDDSSGLYYVSISPTEVKNNTFNINQFYKVQIRFDGYSGSDAPSATSTEAFIQEYLLAHQDLFSEWSSVCLIKPILQPNIQIKPFDLYAGDTPQSFNKGIISISGKLFFGDGSVTETETLQSYKIQILEPDSEEVVLESPTIYTGDNVDPNDINYKIDLQGLNTDNNQEFIFKIIISTKNQYVTSKQWDFQIADFLDDFSFDPELTVEMDNEEGIATLHVVNVQTVFGTIYIKRGSSIDNFESWEDFYIEKVAGDIDLTLEDNTVSSLVWYRYSIQMENSVGGLTRVYRSDVFMPEFYDAIISRGEQQFKIQYNYSISSFKPVVNRTKIDTLGGRFPKFAENAILNYKQFSISGLISSETDVHQKFLNKRDYFDDNYQRYQVYKSDMGIQDLVRNDYDDYLTESEVLTSYLTTTQNDWLWEREFREEAMKWLNDGEPKLYRSMTEGNMAVMLTDISLTPNSTLGRRLWTFTATVYEIAEADSLSTLDSLGIFDVVKPDNLTTGSGEVDPEPEYVEVIKVGQLYNYTVTHTNSVVSEILDNLRTEYGAIPGGEDGETVYDSASVLADKLPDGLYLKNVKIFFNNKPNLYRTDSAGNLRIVYDPATAQGDQTLTLGYTFSFSTDTNSEPQTIFVNSRGYYQIPDKLNVTGLYFSNIGQSDDSGVQYPADNVTVEYVMVYKELNNTSTIVSGQTVDRVVIGQYEDVFEYGEYLGEKIRAKYSFAQTGQYYQQMQYWRGICLDVESYAIAHIQYYRDDDYNDYLVGGTGVLHMIKNVPVKDMCFMGRRMTQKDFSRQEYLDDWEYVLDPGPEDDDEEISDIAYWNEDLEHPVGINFDRMKKKYSTIWNITEMTLNEITKAGEGYVGVEDIAEPKRNTVYNINGELKIYYKDDWYDFTQNSDGTGVAHVPIEGMINYLGNVVQSTYA